MNPLQQAIAQRAKTNLSRLKKKRGKSFLRRPPRQIEPKAIVRRYQIVLSQRQEELQSLVEEALIRSLPTLIASYNQNLPIKRDSIGDDVIGILNGIRVSFGKIWNEPKTKTAAIITAEDTERWNKKELQKTVFAVAGVDVFTQEPWLRSQVSDFVQENVSLIKSVDEKYFAEIEQTVYRGARQGLSTKEIADEIRERGDVSTSRARLIARDQINKFNGNLSEIRQRDLGVTRYIWRTAKDERVREEHAEREGEVFEWSKPPEDGHPGEAINCRCYAEPILEDLE